MATLLSLTLAACTFGDQSADVLSAKPQTSDESSAQPTTPAPTTKQATVPTAGASMTAAQGNVVLDSTGVPRTYTTEAGDTLDGILLRFGLSADELAEANKVPYVSEQGNTYFIREGHTIQLRKNPVDAKAGRGATVNNSFGQAIFYTTVEGDSFDSLGYQFRSTTEQILLYNPALSANNPLPTGTKVRLIPGTLKIEKAQGEFTADSNEVPLTYTTAPGDTESQVSFRFAITDLRAANRPSSGTGGSWFSYVDLPNGELTPGQTISLSLVNPINKPEA
ncbi:LysM peptidoglycan-binding domain-containing protein [Paenarthrobacter sp. NPDC089714]|uniref:LysM peptidoglycan-binding domain-containing protein n=1 Tax=Paenarthrobacter sp. NPDC089714 TaxID=3364377 RepID=UPI00380FAC46